MKKAALIVFMSLVSTSAFASVYVKYPEVRFQSQYGDFSVPVTDVCHNESDDTLSTVVRQVCTQPTANGCGQHEDLTLSAPRSIPMIVEVPIIQKYADGVERRIGLNYYKLRSCN